MPVPKGFWKPINHEELIGREKAAAAAYMNAVDSGAPEEEIEEAQQAFIAALLPRFEKNNLVPKGKELITLYKPRNLLIGFRHKRQVRYFDMGPPLAEPTSNDRIQRGVGPDDFDRLDLTDGKKAALKRQVDQIIAALDKITLELKPMRFAVEAAKMRRLCGGIDTSYKDGEGLPARARSPLNFARLLH
jgi:hypothetical protein